jgi:hypothetical protein
MPVVLTHVPVAHEPAHVMPQPPQFVLVLVATQVLLQSAWPEGQPHDPLLHCVPLGHMVQPPQ